MKNIQNWEQFNEEQSIESKYKNRRKFAKLKRDLGKAGTELVATPINDPAHKEKREKREKIKQNLKRTQNKI